MLNSKFTLKALNTHLNMLSKYVCKNMILIYKYKMNFKSWVAYFPCDKFYQRFCNDMMWTFYRLFSNNFAFHLENFHSNYKKKKYKLICDIFNLYFRIFGFNKAL